MDWEKSRDLHHCMRTTLRTVGKYKTNKVAVELYGRLFYYTKEEVMALQVMAKKTHRISEEAFEEFCKNVIVYSGRNKRSSKYTMHFRPDGNFSNEFEPGFWDTPFNLLMELL